MGISTHGAQGAIDECAKDKEFVLSFEDITVHVPAQSNCCGSNKNSPLRNYGQEYFGMSVEHRDAFYTLDRVSGYVKSGETLLVLGTIRAEVANLPSSGRSVAGLTRQMNCVEMLA